LLDRQQQTADEWKNADYGQRKILQEKKTAD
jgi:hypothetical protein